MAALPSWLDVRAIPREDVGERAAIALAETVNASRLIDEAAGRAEAKPRHLRVTIRCAFEAPDR